MNSHLIPSSRSVIICIFPNSQFQPNPTLIAQKTPPTTTSVINYKPHQGKTASQAKISTSASNRNIQPVTYKNPLIGSNRMSSRNCSSKMHPTKRNISQDSTSSLPTYLLPSRNSQQQKNAYENSPRNSRPCKDPTNQYQQVN